MFGKSTGATTKVLLLASAITEYETRTSVNRAWSLRRYNVRKLTNRNETRNGVMVWYSPLWYSP